MKKYVSLISLLCIIMLITGCSKKAAPNTPKKESTPEKTPQAEQTVPPQADGSSLFVNSLTGEAVLESQEKANQRPVAIAINNQDGMRCHQTGLDKADIVYETYVEGGITRTLAIFKDVTVLGEVGSIRSARYDFVDLACSNDATYIHAGVDYTYCEPYMNKLGLDDINLLENAYYSYTHRNDNGHLLEHTLYSTGEKLRKMLKDKGWRMTVKDTHSGNWQNFKQTPSALPGGAATELNITFSELYKDHFKYDAQKGSYIKDTHRNNQKHQPAYTEELAFDNVVVLYTTVADRGDGYRVAVGLKSGSGYYFSQGTYQEINWEKGSTYDSFKFTDKEGNPLSYNPGNSWVCLVSQSMHGKVTFN